MCSLFALWIYILANFITVCCLVFELHNLEEKEKEEEIKKMKKLSIIAPYIHDARHHAHPLLSGLKIHLGNWRMLGIMYCQLHPSPSTFWEFIQYVKIVRREGQPGRQGCGLWT